VYAREVLTAADLEPVLRVDAAVNLADVDWPLYEQLIQLEPFGMGKPHAGVWRLWSAITNDTTHSPGEAPEIKSGGGNARDGRTRLGMGGAKSAAGAGPTGGLGLYP